MSDPGTRPLKRTRLSVTDDPTDSGPSGSSSTSSNLHRHPEIWYDDGNLILVAHDTAFRIYRGLIAGQSSVFSDLFTSSTSSPDEFFEGCPVIHLSDSPHDLVHLLRVLLPQSRIHYRATREGCVPTFDELSAVIRLAHKYNVSQVLDQALASLRELGFAASFAAHCSNPLPIGNSPLALDPSFSIAVVNLARLTNTPSLLPLALYHCAYLGSDVLDGWAREDGTLERLSDADLRRCIDGRAALAHEHAVFIFSVFDDTVCGAAAGCTRPGLCSAGLRNGQRALVCLEGLAVKYHMLHPSWVEAVTTLGDGKNVCASCAREMLERTKKEQKRIFNKLPQIFGITVEGWGAEESEPGMATLAGEGE